MPVINEEGVVIEHFGVKGMRWGVRKDKIKGAYDRYRKWDHQTERKLNRKFNRALLGKKKGDRLSDKQDKNKARYVDDEGKPTKRAKELGKKQVQGILSGALVGVGMAALTGNKNAVAQAAVSWAMVGAAAVTIDDMLKG